MLVVDGVRAVESCRPEGAMSDPVDLAGQTARGLEQGLDGGRVELFQLRASVMSRRFWDDFESLLPLSPPQETDQAHLEAP